MQRSDESVTVAWEGLDVTGSFSGVAEGLSNARDCLVQSVVSVAE